MQLVTWEEVVGHVLGLTAIVGVFGLVAKGLFEKYLAARLEQHRSKLTQETEEAKARMQHANALELEKLRSAHAAQTEAHKASLQREGALELERVRSSLRREHFEHELRLSELQKRRADVIEAVYARVSRVHNSLGDALKLFEGSGETPRPERFLRALKDAQEFEEFFDEKRVLLPERCCEVLDSFKKTLRIAVVFGRGINGNWPTGIGRQDDVIREKMTEAWSSIEHEVPVIRKELEGLMRALLGDPARNYVPSAAVVAIKGAEP